MTSIAAELQQHMMPLPFSASVPSSPIINPRTAGGGGTYIYMCPHQFFADSRKVAARSAAKFGIAIHSSFAHLV